VIFKTMVGLKSNKDPYQIQMAVDNLVEVCLPLHNKIQQKKKKKKKGITHLSFFSNIFS
jgi:hypothetical protein